jgi:hypothetical protein
MGMIGIGGELSTEQKQISGRFSDSMDDGDIIGMDQTGSIDTRH